VINDMTREQLLGASTVKTVIGLAGIDVVDNDDAQYDRIVGNLALLLLSDRGPCVLCQTEIPNRYGDNAVLFCTTCK
jgi:hypothetical protein